MARYINRRIRDHIEESIHSNPIVFSQIDQSPRNGLITWDEYYTYFLKSLGYDDAFIRKVDRRRSSNLDRKTKDMLTRDKALWNEAARSDSYSLTLDEFLAFRHPGKFEKCITHSKKNKRIKKFKNFFLKSFCDFEPKHTAYMCIKK